MGGAVKASDLLGNPFIRAQVENLRPTGPGSKELPNAVRDTYGGFLAKVKENENGPAPTLPKPPGPAPDLTDLAVRAAGLAEINRQRTGFGRQAAFGLGRALGVGSLGGSPFSLKSVLGQ